ncbi:hypothetical protein RCH21_000573 [Arthrobacter sp. PL16]|uniref:acVLRF1 family peptidyl-tRNA hydrolase n=1 Tax=Arthrobacter sp. PL16 TaxID=3071720 RepID=UPI002E0A54F3|nr:hypothetical protein [Arthrobacter sp. PL16]
MPSTRSVLVEAHRLDGWLARFGERNGTYTVEPDGERADGSIRLAAVNGCTAVLAPPLPVRARSPREPAGAPAASDQRALGEHLLSGVDPSATVGLLLIRRGGYSVGISREGTVVASKTGTRYVQGKTAAGGWSQQRFARRRANQADALVEETAARAAKLYAADPPSLLQLGGDRALATGTLGESALKAYAHLPQVPFLTVPDPRFAILKEAARSALSIRITVTDPPPGAV